MAPAGAATVTPIIIWKAVPILKRMICFFSVPRGVEEPSHAHRHQLLHREPVLGRRPGHCHLSPGQSASGHHRDLVLRTDALQGHPLLASKLQPLLQGSQLCLSSSLQFIIQSFRSNRRGTEFVRNGIYLIRSMVQDVAFNPLD